MSAPGGFGRWYEEKKQDDVVESNNDTPGSSWTSSFEIFANNVTSGNTDALLPLFNTENLPQVSWTSMKQSMEAQMPKKILGMGYQQRFKVFCGLLFLSALFFALAFFVGIPVIAIKPRKFALSFTMGSLTFMGSFGIMKGPMEHLKNLFQPDRLPFTFFYFTSMILTLYFTFSFGGISGYLLVISASAVQLIALLWYLISFLPGGTAGLQYVFMVMVHLLRPVIVVVARLQAKCMSYCLSWVASRSMSGGS